MKKIETKGSQEFNVPNTDEGKLFIKLLRKFANPIRNAKISCRGRGSRKEYAKKVGRYTAQASISREYAEWIAVYFKRHAYVNQLYAEKVALMDEVKLLKLKIDATPTPAPVPIATVNSTAPENLLIQTLRLQVQELEKECNSLDKECSELKLDNDRLSDEIISLGKITVPKSTPDPKGITITIPVGTNIRVVQG